MKFTIYGELTDLNAYLKALNSYRLVGSKIKREETERVAYEIKFAKIPAPTKYPIKIIYRWYSKDNRKDIDNVSFSKKFLNDGMVMAGLIPNDSRKFISGFSDEFYIDKNNPRTEVEIYESNPTKIEK